MSNYLLHEHEINKSFTTLIEADYMLGVWKIDSGIRPVQPPWEIIRNKQLLDYQELCSVDCNNEYFIASQGSVVYDCCPTGFTKLEIPGPLKCCPDDTYVYRNSDGKCVSTIAPYGEVDSIPCPCCPEGYIWNSSTRNCVGVKSSDVVNATSCGYECVATSGVTTPLIACSEVVPDSTLLSAPILGENTPGCYTGVTWCKVVPPPIVVTRTYNTYGSNVTIYQFEVDVLTGPVSGTTTFTPIVAGVAYLIGKTTISVKQRVVLTLGTDYTFDNITGTLTLQLGRVFNPGEVYEITAF